MSEYPEIIHARLEDLQIRANFETRQLEITYLPTGATTSLSVEEATEYCSQLVDSIRCQGYDSDNFRRLDAMIKETREMIRDSKAIQ
jgi:hypothetical protein